MVREQGSDANWPGKLLALSSALCYTSILLASALAEGSSAKHVFPHRHARDVAVRRLPLSAAGAKVRGIESREEGLRALQDAGALVMMMGVCVPREDLDHRSRGRARG